MHVVDGHAGVERDGREDGDLRGSVEAVHVGRGIGLGEALGLGFLERVVVAQALFHHAGEHVVRRAVHDAHDRRDLVGNERVLERVDDGDATADAGFERNLLACALGRLHDLLAMGGHERLVGRDHILARGECLEDHVACHRGAADELDHDVDAGIVHDVGVVLREQVFHAVLDGLLRVARAHAHQLHVDAVVALEVLTVVLQYLDAAAAHRSRADEPQFNRHVHVSSSRRSKSVSEKRRGARDRPVSQPSVLRT